MESGLFLDYNIQQTTTVLYKVVHNVSSCKKDTISTAMLDAFFSAQLVSSSCTAKGDRQLWALRVIYCLGNRHTFLFLGHTFGLFFLKKCVICEDVI